MTQVTVLTAIMLDLADGRRMRISASASASASPALAAAALSAMR
ncbi:MAG TPA: hypothetical protein VF440_06895 [Novosphingobium sp.]